MKAIVCELCGGNELIKSEGVYQCQHCGTKYTLEEARKLLVSGTVKIDESDKVAELHKAMWRWFDSADFKSASEQAAKIAEIEPNNVDAYFVSIVSSDFMNEPNQHIDTKLTAHLAWLLREKFELGSHEYFAEAERLFGIMASRYTKVCGVLRDKSKGFFSSTANKELHAAFVRQSAGRLLSFVEDIESGIEDFGNAPTSYFDTVRTALYEYAFYPGDMHCSIFLKNMEPHLRAQVQLCRERIEAAREG